MKRMHGRRIAVALIVVLTALHHDFWLWDDPTLLANVVPVGLAYHACFSVIASVVWAAVLYLVWPSEEPEHAEVES